MPITATRFGAEPRRVPSAATGALPDRCGNGLLAAWLRRPGAGDARGRRLTDGSIAIDPGDVDRSNLPVRVPLDVPQALAEAGIRIGLADGSQIDGQLVEPGLLAGRAGPGADGTVRRDLVFVLPRLPAGAAAQVTAEPASPAEPKPPRLAWVEEPAAASLLLGGKPLVRYEKPTYDAGNEASRVATYKPFHHVFDPATGIRITKGDGGQYTHHRGIFFGYNRITHG
ncbi:MAG: hypothetical protein EBX35_08070, partial [Planctomycetia bacterium]|nr:hypothetical protein [Planctomycetia bacterium]